MRKVTKLQRLTLSYSSPWHAATCQDYLSLTCGHVSEITYPWHRSRVRDYLSLTCFHVSVITSPWHASTCQKLPLLDLRPRVRDYLSFTCGHVSEITPNLRETLMPKVATLQSGRLVAARRPADGSHNRKPFKLKQAWKIYTFWYLTELQGFF